MSSKCKAKSINKKTSHCKKPIPVCKPKEEVKQSTFIHLPDFVRKIGPKQISIGISHIPSLIRYSLATFIYITYLCDWKPVLQYLPYYNGKFAEIEEENKQKSSKTNQDESEVILSENQEEQNDAQSSIGKSTQATQQTTEPQSSSELKGKCRPSD